jgi:two-component system, chemotaxis family, protein-glutamate methylesterase/glutaminase
VRVLVVDDSMLFRKVVRDALANEPGVDVVGSAADGRAALEKIGQLHPDVITLDLEMPEVDGLEVLRQLRRQTDPPGVIVVSALTEAGAMLTAQALRLGAFDFVLKPNGSHLDANREQLKSDLLPKIRLLAERRQISLEVEHTAAKCDLVIPPKAAATVVERPPEIVAIGISTGGPASLHQLLPKLPADLPVPVVIVQHMPAKFTRSLADDLDRHSAIHVQEGQDGQRLQAGNVYIAAGGLQTRVERHPRGIELRVTDDPPEKCCKPSVDYLFRSLAEELGPRVLAVIMTGMGDDGTVGCRLLKQRGSRIIAQDAASCVVYGMPRQIIENGLADMIRPLDAISETIEQSVRAGGIPC